MRKIDLKNVVWKEGKYYVAQCLNVDVSIFGKTKKEALAALDEALELYFEDIELDSFAMNNIDNLKKACSMIK